MRLITTLRTFKHNFWTEFDNHHLYEGEYSPLTSEDVDIKISSQYVHFKVPVRKPYQNGAWLEYSEFPVSIRKSVEIWKTIKGEQKKVLQKKITEQARQYFLKKVNITLKQAKALMKLESQASEENWSVKRIHAAHKKIGIAI